ncbi:MAG: murein hydrolase activator EnvC family protein, partial [Actinomycetota bacterium]
MTNRLKRFPASFRFVAVTFALVATASLATSAAAGPPSAEQVQNAKDRVAQLVRDAHVAQRQLDAINIRANEVAAEYDRELGRLEKLNAELLHTQLTLAQARARYDAIVAQLNERARTMFMQGPASDLEFLLGASSFSDLTDRLEYVNVVASNDADLATEVQNTKNVLSAKERNLESLQTAQQAVVVKVREKRQEIADLLQQATSKYNEIAAKKADAEDLAKKLSKQRQAWVNSQFSFAGSPHSSVAMPPGWKGTLEVCPVGQPRAYGDGFGAPRYAGGYHLHAGVDILAPMGTPIYATFDGYATENPNGLGGLAVEVHGAPGYTYNAHLSAYSDHSTGTVQAGDIIGYVGDSGDAQGGPPHDHFEFHPSSFPSGWPASYYGYTIVG